MAFEKDPNEIGALWLKSGAKGDYLTGEIGGQKVVCFAVTAKSEKSPTWRVLKSKPREEGMPNDQRTSVGRVVTDQDVPF
jgi:hypothetical protein